MDVTHFAQRPHVNHTARSHAISMETVFFPRGLRLWRIGIRRRRAPARPGQTGPSESGDLFGMRDLVLSSKMSVSADGAG